MGSEGSEVGGQRLLPFAGAFPTLLETRQCCWNNKSECRCELIRSPGGCPPSAWGLRPSISSEAGLLLRLARWVRAHTPCHCRWEGSSEEVKNPASSRDFHAHPPRPSEAEEMVAGALPVKPRNGHLIHASGPTVLTEGVLLRGSVFLRPDFDGAPSTAQSTGRLGCAGIRALAAVLPDTKTSAVCQPRGQ